MNIVEYLKKVGVKHEVFQHRSAFTAQQMAAEQHIPGIKVAKPVIVKADNKYYMCVLPACCKIDLDNLKKQLGAKKLELADEKEMTKLFPDCSLGAEPPFGNLYDMTTVMDKMLEPDDEIVFQAGTHEQAVRLSMADYRKLVNPSILTFCYHLA